MSRHSKNNTAHSIFTTGERHMLRDWGTVEQRLGADSIKAVDSCVICLSQAVEPQVCDRGHLFCKECIVKNLLEQRRAKKRQMARWTAAQAQLKREMEDGLATEQAAKIEAFDRADIPDPEAWTRFSEHRKYGKLNPEQAERLRAKEAILRAKERPDKEALKASLVKTCFWVPEMHPNEDPISTKPDKLLLCPAENSKSHPLKLSSLTSVKAVIDHDKFSCESCKQTLTHQSSGVLKGCGHLLCMKCIRLYCLPAESCVLCSVPVTAVISLQRGGTSYSSHNEVTARVVKPVFNC